MTIISIYGLTNAAMTEKVKEKIFKIACISSIEETNLSEDKWKWLVVTRKSYKTQVEIKVDFILRGMVLHIISRKYNNQPDTITREYSNPTLVSYATAFQRGPEDGLKSKKHCYSEAN